MPKYEIMTILDPKAEATILENLLSAIFSQNSSYKLVKLENSSLAYPIKKSKTAQYFLINLDSPANLIEEFVRRANITKSIWRYLIINLDSEKGFNQKPKNSDRHKRTNPRRDHSDRPNFKSAPRARQDQNSANPAEKTDKPFQRRNFRPNTQGGAKQSFAQQSSDKTNSSQRGKTSTSSTQQETGVDNAKKTQESQ
ncbi:30S ribosomal protein S6 [Mesomycoplasma ovipneumoniae]|uniref:Small ribosomal subunit protein bS6 n=1 Tax=Mesomycoplasma ovipneumoniae TaxID=29562 RepID=A0AAP6CTP6_9BACT|nr:30S ribosomal protein S6 [Mesomycoplasma ovipneumoniae]MDW2907034.1 30S ribosomal protein S6 [Mesomycoplasma ovipneumoniae]MDW2907815.1 30S ribosomal protein S6 [Mesomycoplasma ovipneumoniae]MDW2910606.1 30S ribosomal protein S6 [Mesomycoplasma ovipneumoniae]MDW2912147.1 30S ribosomal protein S6 [Mesomycoplasma ovipneumoniae]MDW2914979.1 30S ribosomal protein S6 [Mesomycoplasma ovipneumoniae]